MQHHVFLSYHPKDADIMQRVRVSLLAGGLTVCIDHDLISANDVEVAIQHSGCFVLILSPDANGNTDIEQHIAIARQANLRIFPVVGRGDEWSAIPKAFIGKQMIDVRANYEARMERLTVLVKSYLNLGS